MSARSNIQWNVFHEDPSVLNARLANIFEPAEYALEGLSSATSMKATT